MDKPLVKLFEDLGDSIHLQWRKYDFADGRLGQIAAQEISRCGFQNSVGLDDLSALPFRPNALTTVPLNDTFGDAALVVYNAPRFVIELLFWADGTTSIHQHSFDGAFCVLLGGSFHGQYRFDRHKHMNAMLSLGDLVLASTELLRVGDIRLIDAGSRFIHNLFHLECPSVTLVVRTHTNREVGPQLKYLPPGLAYDPFFRDRVWEHQSRYLRMLIKIEHPSALSSLLHYLSESDWFSEFLTLDSLRGTLTERALWPDVMNWMREAQKDRAGWFSRAFDELERRQVVVSKRKLVKDPELRFFLALLLNVPCLSRIRELTYDRFGDRDPARQLLTWVAGMLDVHGIQYDETNLELVRYALENSSDEYVISRFREEYDKEDVEVQLPLIKELCSGLRENVLFTPLFNRTNSEGGREGRERRAAGKVSYRLRH